MDAAEHVVDGVRLDDVLHLEIVVLVDDDVRLVRRAEKVVPHPEDVLVGTREKEGHVVGLTGSRLVQRNFVPNIFQVDELFHLPVAVAGDVA